MPGYRDIIRETRFLDVGSRSREVGGGRIIGISDFDNIVEFELQGLTDTYTEYIRVEALDNIDTSVLTLSDLTTLIQSSNLEVACTCPAFTYWGFQYVSAVDDYGLWIAGIAPDIRNPQLKGGGCKHIHRILTEWPQFAPQIASFYPYASEQSPIATIRRTARNRKINSLYNRLNKLKNGSGSNEIPSTL